MHQFQYKYSTYIYIYVILFLITEVFVSESLWIKEKNNIILVFVSSETCILIF